MRRSWLVLGLLVLGSGLVLNGCSGRQARPQPGPEQSKALFEAKCSQCHGLNVVYEQKHTRTGWQELVRREAARKIWSIRGSEQEAIAAYLFTILPADSEPPPVVEEPRGVEGFLDPPKLRDN